MMPKGLLFGKPMVAIWALFVQISCMILLESVSKDQFCAVVDTLCKFLDDFQRYILEKNMDKSSSGEKSNLWGKLFVTIRLVHTCAWIDLVQSCKKLINHMRNYGLKQIIGSRNQYTCMQKNY